MDTLTPAAHGALKLGGMKIRLVKGLIPCVEIARQERKAVLAASSRLSDPASSRQSHAYANRRPRSRKSTDLQGQIVVFPGHDGSQSAHLRADLFPVVRVEMDFVQVPVAENDALSAASATFARILRPRAGLTPRNRRAEIRFPPLRGRKRQFSGCREDVRDRPVESVRPAIVQKNPSKKMYMPRAPASTPRLAKLRQQLLCFADGFAQAGDNPTRRFLHRLQSPVCRAFLQARQTRRASCRAWACSPPSRRGRWLPTCRCQLGRSGQRVKRREELRGDVAGVAPRGDEHRRTSRS